MARPTATAELTADSAADRTNGTTGLVPPSAGTALVDVKAYATLPNPGAVMGTLLDAGAVHPGRTGRTHLRILASTIGVPARRVDEVLELVGLPDAARRRIGGHSLG